MKKAVIIFLLLTATVAGISCRNKAITSGQNTPAEAIKYYYTTTKKDQTAAGKIQFIDMYAYKGKILVYYKFGDQYSDQYSYQWVDIQNDGFTAHDGSSSSSSQGHYDVDTSGIGGSSYGGYSAIGAYVNNPDVCYVKLYFSNGKTITKFVTAKQGFMVFFAKQSVTLTKTLVYDKNKKILPD
jgi:hypothetical protein